MTLTVGVRPSCYKIKNETKIPLKHGLRIEFTKPTFNL